MTAAALLLLDLLLLLLLPLSSSASAAASSMADCVLWWWVNGACVCVCVGVMGRRGGHEEREDPSESAKRMDRRPFIRDIHCMGDPQHPPPHCSPHLADDPHAAKRPRDVGMAQRRRLAQRRVPAELRAEQRLRRRRRRRRCRGPDREDAVGVAVAGQLLEQRVPLDAGARCVAVAVGLAALNVAAAAVVRPASPRVGKASAVDDRQIRRRHRRHRLHVWRVPHRSRRKEGLEDPSIISSS